MNNHAAIYAPTAVERLREIESITLEQFALSTILSPFLKPLNPSWELCRNHDVQYGLGVMLVANDSGPANSAIRRKLKLLACLPPFSSFPCAFLLPYGFPQHPRRVNPIIACKSQHFLILDLTDIRNLKK